jgi:hypothetical protein
MYFNFLSPTSWNVPYAQQATFLKTILLSRALENYILLIYMYIRYVVINKNKLTWLTGNTLRLLPLREQVCTQYHQVKNSMMDRLRASIMQYVFESTTYSYKITKHKNGGLIVKKLLY